MTKYSAYGTILEVDLLGGTAYGTIGYLDNIGGPNLARDSIDVTTHDSTSAWREFVKGLKDGGDISFDVVYDPTESTHDATTGLLADFDNEGTIPAWRLTFPDGSSTQWTFDGFLTGFSPSEPKDDKLSASITVKVTGVPTLA
jgi:predicted secreted protein